MTQTCSIPLEQLIDYRFGELDPEIEEQLEEHLFGCPECSERAALLVELGPELARLLREGSLSGSGSAETVRAAAGLGLKLRSYTLESGAAVACTVAPDDALVIVRLHVEADTAERVDVETEIRFADSGEQQARVIEDVAFDHTTGEVVYLFSGDFVRSLPRSTWVMHAQVHSPEGLMRLGPYTMNHTPWAELPAPPDEA